MKLKSLIESFKYAGRGVVYVFRHEQNFRIQLYLTMAALILMRFFQLRKSEMMVVALLILLVLILELLNSAVEKLSDVLKPRLSYQIQTVKDIMAAMVLLASLGAAAIGLTIFWPYFKNIF